MLVDFFALYSTCIGNDIHACCAQVRLTDLWREQASVIASNVTSMKGMEELRTSLRQREDALYDREYRLVKRESAMAKREEVVGVREEEVLRKESARDRVQGEEGADAQNAAS
jgi:hypothetical protein